MSNTLKFGNGEWYGKEGTILAYNSENNNYKPLPVTFDRASSATRVNKQGLIETVGADQPRVDYLNDSNGALLLEPSRTNYLLQSNQFDTTWVSLNTTETGGQVGVGGSNNAWLITKSAPSARIYQTISVSGVQTYSVYAKAGTLNWVAVSNNLAYTFFNLSNGTIGTNVGTTNANIDDVGNGWYRCSITYSGTATDARIYPSQGDNNSNGTSGNIYIQYAQLEAGSYATSYIPTSGSAVTRSADVCNQTPPDGVIGQTEGTVYWEINVETTVATANENILNIDNGSGFGHTIYFSKSATGNLVGEMYVSGGLQASFTKTNITKGVHKMAMGYANNNTAFFVDGVQIGVTDTSCTVPLTSRVQLGNGALGASDCLSNDLKLYNTRLSNAELAALTQV